MPRRRQGCDNAAECHPLLYTDRADAEGEARLRVLWVEVARRLAALADQSPIPAVGCVEVYDEEGKVASTGEVVRGG